MQPLGTYDLCLNLFVAVVMPLIIIGNLTDKVRSNPRNAYLWHEHASFMWLSIGILGLLSLWSMIQLAGHFGLVPAQAVDVAVLVIGIPFLLLAVAEIWLGVRLLRQYVRGRRSPA